MRARGSIISTFALAMFVFALAANATVHVQHIGASKGGQVDFDKAAQEATELLCEYLKIDTTVPPGNEKLGAEYLASVLKQNGIEARLYETAPNRSCLYARLKGSGKKKAVVLLNHIDVVPAVAADWKHPPFAGEVIDNDIWGRGALDMKGFGIVELKTMLMIKRQGLKLDRDIIFLATPDEEVGGDFGARWFTEKHPELLSDAEFLINEGSHIITGSDGKPQFWGVNFSEKNVLWLKLTATGQAGHASMPIKDSATNRLARALEKLVAVYPMAVRSPQVVPDLKKISQSRPEPLKGYYAQVVEDMKNPDYVSGIENDRMLSSMLVNTASLTVLKAGYKTNVIPGEASAEIDCRLLPGVDKDEFIQRVQKIIQDPTIKTSVLEWNIAGASEIQNDLFDSIKKVAAEESPGTPVRPVVVPWFTDSHWFRKLGINCYGFEPFEIKPELLASMHGIDERVPVSVYSTGLRRFYKILVDVVQAKP
ncbi:MAG: M20/M25/M40 family metallo-hydrolase [Candidatus Melainabacteria bacterium]|nr:M20/M25/M40 family metallo-hydrolase [Candidatus Melainabacteria bacterium]